MSFLPTLLCGENVPRHRAVPVRPLSFESNQGQAPSDILYLQRGKGASLGFLKGSVRGVLQTAEARAEYSLTFPGSRKGSVPRGEGEAGGRTNILRGSDPKRWNVDIKNYSSIRYDQIYAGIDLLFHAKADELEYDFEVQPGADAEHIRLRWSGEGKLSLRPTGELVWHTLAGDTIQRAPVAYQMVAGRRVAVAVRYELRDGDVRFRLGRYDRQQMLVIDPVLTYSTYLGGSSAELVYGMTVDTAGNIYIAGTTISPNFPLSAAPLQKDIKGRSDSFITKLSAQGTLVYSTLLGGADTDTVKTIAVDPQGSIYFAGSSASADFPMVNARQPTLRGGAPLGTDAIFGKLNPAGSGLVFSSFWGGSYDESAEAITLDASGNFYLAGYTFSDNFPVGQGGFQTSNRGFFNGFVTKFSPDSAITVYSTYLGGRNADFLLGIAVDSTGAAYVTGYASSTDFPTLSGFQTSNRGGAGVAVDVVVAKLNPTGTGLVFSTFYGGGGSDIGRAIALDQDGNAWVTGETGSSNLQMTDGAVQRELSGPQDAFVIKVAAKGDALLYSTYWGGTRDDGATDIALGTDGSVYVAGATASTNLRTVDAVQPTSGGATDVFVLRLNPAGSTILQSTYLGGTSTDTLFGLFVNNQGVVYLAGETASVNFPVSANGLQRTTGGGPSDAFVAVIDSSAAANPFTLSTERLTFTAVPGAAIPAQSFAIRVTTGTPTWTVESTTAAGGAWLLATPRSGTGAATVDVTAATTGLAVGTYNGTIVVTNTRLNTRSTVAVALTIGAAGGTVPNNGVVSAASFTGGAVAPGQLVTIFGSGIGPAQLTGAQLTAQGTLATRVAETRVLFDTRPAPLIYVSASQISAIVPYGVNGTTTEMQVEFRGVRSNAVSLPVTATAPGLFTANSSGKGPGAILNQDGSFNNGSNAAEVGSVVVLYGTGEGAVDPVVVDGAINASSLPKPREPITVRIGGKDAEVLYGGAAPGLVAGVFQINVRIPEGVEPGNAPVVVMIGRATSSPEVTVAVR